MLKKVFLFYCFLTFGIQGFSQGPQLSPLSELSLLTVGTGDELAAKFGHSAIRFKDPSLGIDVVYGYGTYDFEDPNFYLNFTRGKLAYTISRIPFRYFMRSYQLEQRWVKEQKLNLNLDQRKAIVSFLEHNLLPENRKYKYDFLFDNCATRIPLVFEKNFGDELVYDYTHFNDHYTFRELIHQNLKVNSWSNFGIDLALGAVIDRKATPYEHMFLPLYVYEQMKQTTLDGKPLIKEEQVLLNIPKKEDKTLFILTPVFWLALLLLSVLIITYIDVKNEKRTRWMDVVLFSVTGLAGILILFLWFFTDHEATKMNFNALWAFAPNIIATFFIARRKLPKWFQNYTTLLLGLLFTNIVLWILKVQVFSILLIFILSALFCRYLYLFMYLKKQNTQQHT